MVRSYKFTLFFSFSLESGLCPRLLGPGTIRVIVIDPVPNSICSPTNNLSPLSIHPTLTSSHYFPFPLPNLGLLRDDMSTQQDGAPLKRVESYQVGTPAMPLHTSLGPALTPPSSILPDTSGTSLRTSKMLFSASRMYARRRNTIPRRQTPRLQAMTTKHFSAT